MSEEPPSVILKYSPFKSVVAPSFWHTFTQLKLDVDRLNETERHIWGYYSISDSIGKSSFFHVDYSAFNNDFVQPKTMLGVHGVILNKNTIEAFKATDKMTLLKEHGLKIIESIKSGEALKNPSLLTRFLLLSFADLKKYKFYYWFAFPAFAVPNTSVNFIGTPKKVGDVFSEAWVKGLAELHFSLSEWTDRVAYVVEEDGDSFRHHSLHSALSVVSDSKGQISDGVYVVIADPGDRSENPGWPLRNILSMLAYQWPQVSGKPLKIIGWRFSFSRSQGKQINNSIFFEVLLPTLHLNESHVVDSLVWHGWERNDKDKYVPRMVNLSKEMDPTRLAETSVDLNLKLMKWRLAPKLDLDIIKNTSCLLLGSGTLGCAVARTLLSWGVRTITLVDNGQVSYSNPVRQSLFVHADCANGGRPKAEAAADALRSIFPRVVAKGVQITIPMPGHVVGESLRAETQESVEMLEQLVKDHDVVFLLMDSRESRWLPTVLASAFGKITICSALGFDTFLVIRHGVLSSASGDHGSPTGGAGLGCYFCNDVTAPGNSQVDRTLDQQCTVTRPGLSFIAAGLAVELLVSLLQHPLKGEAPACDSPDTDNSPLSIIPHSIRGFLSQFTQILPASPRFKHCIACCNQVLEEYTRSGFDFLLKVFNDPKYLEDIAGLTKLHQQTEEADVLVWSDEEDLEVQ